MHRKNLIFLEIFLNIFIFVICISICYSLLIYSSIKRNRVVVLDKAVIVATDISERYKNSSGDIEELCSNVGGEIEENNLYLYYDKDFNRVNEKENAVYLLHLSIEDDFAKLILNRDKSVVFSWEIGHL